MCDSSNKRYLKSSSLPSITSHYLLENEIQEFSLSLEGWQLRGGLIKVLKRDMHMSSVAASNLHVQAFLQIFRIITKKINKHVHAWNIELDGRAHWFLLTINRTCSWKQLFSMFERLEPCSSDQMGHHRRAHLSFWKETFTLKAEHTHLVFRAVSIIGGSCVSIVTVTAWIQTLSLFKWAAVASY